MQVQRRSPVGKFPVLVDGERSVAEASIIIEYLQMNYPGPVRLIPDDPAGALGRLAIMPEDGLALATERLERAYAWLDGYLGTRTWAAGGITPWPLRGVDGAVLCGLDVPDSGAVCGGARLPRAAAGAAFLCPGGR